MTTLETPRLRLEPYQAEHFAGLYKMNSDPTVMRFITGRAETEDELRAGIARVQARWAKYGFSWWAFIEKATGEVVGAGTIQHLGHEEHRPLEIGWRLNQSQWKKGFAIEAARRMADFAFLDLSAPLLTAVCDPENTASRTVMERLGMTHGGSTQAYGFELAYYELSREAWQAAR